jgi:fructokinase
MSVAGSLSIGVDLGGTKIESAVLDSHGNFVSRVRRATPQKYEETLRTVAEATAEATAGLGLDAQPIGIGVPGSISPRTGLMRNANSTWLNGRPLASDLQAALGRPVRLANDANCFALSEAKDGAGAGARVVFGVIIGTGCGGGLAVDGELLDGAAGIAGEWGHTSLPWPSVPETQSAALCWCGKRGCLETWISGSGFAGWASAALGAQWRCEEIAELAVAGDATAVGCIDLLQDRIARGLAMVINIIDPDVIVLGGGLSNLEGLADGVQGRLPAYVFSDAVATRVVRNRFGDSSGVRGAAWLWPGSP